jgi:hypothetical protein
MGRNIPEAIVPVPTHVRQRKDCGLTDRRALPQEPDKGRSMADDEPVVAPHERKGRPGGKKATPLGGADGRPPAGPGGIPRSDGRIPNVADLVEPGTQYWSDRSPEERVEHTSQLETFFKDLVEDFLKQSDVCVDRYIELNKAYKLWRVSFIILTGFLAILNVFIASLPSRSVTTATITNLSIIAAVYAAIIAVVSNIENFLKYRERSQAFRQAREDFLDAHRQYTMLWLSYVHPFGDTPTACINASRLYRRVVIRDQELRALVKQLTDTDRNIK